MSNDSTHTDLLKLVTYLDSDFEPYGKRSRAGAGGDCSCGCKHYLKLRGDLGNDWGVCTNPQSPRAGLLTFEHQGCEQYDGKAKSNLEQQYDLLCAVEELISESKWLNLFERTPSDLHDRLTKRLTTDREDE